MKAWKCSFLLHMWTKPQFRFYYRLRLLLSVLIGYRYWSERLFLMPLLWRYLGTGQSTSCHHALYLKFSIGFWVTLPRLQCRCWTTFTLCSSFHGSPVVWCRKPNRKCKCCRILKYCTLALVKAVHCPFRKHPPKLINYYINDCVSAALWL